MIARRLISIGFMVLFVFSAHAMGGEVTVTGTHKGFILIKADCSTLQKIMEEKGFSRYVTWLAFTDFNKRQVWYSEDLIERFLEKIPLVRRIHVTPLEHELRCIDDIKYRIKTAIRDRDMQRDVALQRSLRRRFE